VRLGRDPADVEHLGEDLADAQRADPVDGHQRAVLLGHCLGDLALEVFQSRVEAFEVVDVVQGELLAGLADRGARPHREEQPAGRSMRQCQPPNACSGAVARAMADQAGLFGCD
jgi:hypothetical protein